MLTILEFADQIGIKRTDPDNWRRRCPLRTAYKPTVAGRAQEYSRANVIELAMIAAFLKHGFLLPSAIAYADMVVRNDKAGALRDWVLLPAGSKGEGAVATNEPSSATMTELAAKSPVGGVAAVHIKGALETIDELFAVPK